MKTPSTLKTYQRTLRTPLKTPQTTKKKKHSARAPFASFCRSPRLRSQHKRPARSPRARQRKRAEKWVCCFVDLVVVYLLLFFKMLTVVDICLFVCCFLLIYANLVLLWFGLIIEVFMGFVAYEFHNYKSGFIFVWFDGFSKDIDSGSSLRSSFFRRPAHSGPPLAVASVVPSRHFVDDTVS